MAADSTGARRTSAMALDTARRGLVTSVLVTDEEIVRARQALWDHRRLAVEHGAATALAALTSLDRHISDQNPADRAAVPATSYRPVPGERVCVALCGANTDPSTPVQPQD